MALTRPTLNNILTNVVAFADPITVLHQGATNANVDVGFLFNRANGLVSNVSIYWSESSQSFITAFTANTGVTDSNITPTSYANLTIGNLLMVNGSILNVTGNINGNTVGTHYGNVSATGNVSTSGNVYASSFFYANGTPFTSSSYGNVQLLANLAAGSNPVTFGSNIVAASGTASTSTTTGALVVLGGAGIAGNVVAPNFYGNISPTPGLASIYSTGHIVPTANVTYDLGTNANRFRSLYLSGSTIYLGNATITTSSTGDIIINNTGSFAVPVGTTDQRSAVQGAIRYNTTISAFESYDGTTWNKLAYGTVSDFPNGDYGDLTVLADAFGVSTSTTYDCNATGAIITSDLAAAGSASLNPI